MKFFFVSLVLKALNSMVWLFYMLTVILLFTEFLLFLLSLFWFLFRLIRFICLIVFIMYFFIKLLVICCFWLLLQSLGLILLTRKDSLIFILYTWISRKCNNSVFSFFKSFLFCLVSNVFTKVNRHVLNTLSSIEQFLIFF